MRTFLFAVIAVTYIAPVPVWAHGDEKHEHHEESAAHGDHNPAHGGQVGMASSNVHIELVRDGNVVILYFSDGMRKPIGPKAIFVKATAVTDSGEEQIKLKTAGQAFTGQLPKGVNEIQVYTAYQKETGQAWFEIK